MVNKMGDGKMKLRKMGITEADVEAIKEKIDPRFIEIADWIQKEFLPSKREEYNKVHEQLFGAPMANIADYFPLVINKEALSRDEDPAKPDGDTQVSTITGAIKVRTKNSAVLDITRADAFDVVLGHLQEMEHWSAYARFNEDVKTLLSYKRFRNKVKNMSSYRLGAGDTIWKNFLGTCKIVTGTFRPTVHKHSIDSAIVNFAKGVTTAKIAFRPWTALKQLLSYPAYLTDAGPVELAKATAMPWNSLKWAKENLAGFRKRWESRQAGDPRLQKTEVDWKLWDNNVMSTLQRWGMTPNAYVDCVTVAMGAKAIYETRLKKYKGLGYNDEQADAYAKRDAEISVNETQQSSEEAYLSAMQLERTFISTAFSVFRNANMGYGRRLTSAMADFARKCNPSYRREAIMFMQKQFERDGLTPEQAKRASERTFKRSYARDMAGVAVFGFIMQLAWNLGGYAPYLILGDDDKEKEDLRNDGIMHSLAGPVEGFTGGNVISETYNGLRSGKGFSYQPSTMPIVNDLSNAMRHANNDPIEGAGDLLNVLVQAGTGVNPQTFADFYLATKDAFSDEKTEAEFTIWALRMLQVPQSQVEKVYLDEVGMTAEQAQKSSYEELAERYARYKRRHNAPLSNWAYSDEKEREIETKHIKNFEKKYKERIKNNVFADDELKDLEENYNKVDKQVEGLKHRYQGRIFELNDKMKELAMTPEYRKYEAYKKYKTAKDKQMKGFVDKTKQGNIAPYEVETTKQKFDFTKQMLQNEAQMYGNGKDK